MLDAWGSERWAAGLLAVTVGLVLGLALPATAVAPTDEGVAGPPASGEHLNAFLRRSLFPEQPAGACLAGYLILPGDPAWKVPSPAGGST